MTDKKKKKVKWFWEKDRGHDELEHMQQLFQEMWEPLNRGLGPGFARHMRGLDEAPVNISETDKDLIVRVELPGFKKDDIKLVVTKDTFEISAEKKREELERGETFYRREAERHSVHRVFALPMPVDSDSVKARLEEGVLTVTVQKLTAEKKKKKAVEIE